MTIRSIIKKVKKLSSLLFLGGGSLILHVPNIYKEKHLYYIKEKHLYYIKEKILGELR